MSSQSADWLVFQLGEQRWAMAAGSVRQVMRLPTIVGVPGADPHCLGVVAWQGRPVTVVDAAARLARGSPRDAQRERLLIWVQGGRAVGLRVDGVLGLRRLPLSAVCPLQRVLPAPWNIVTGLLREGNDIAPILEPATLFGADDISDGLPSAEGKRAP